MPKPSNSNFINKSSMIFESHCQKAIPTYLRMRMGRRTSFTSRTWPTPTDSSLAPTINSKMSTENSWMDHRCTTDNRMDCSCSLEWHIHDHHMAKSTLNTTNQSSYALTISHCRSNNSEKQNEIKQTTKNSHSINTMMIGSRKSQTHIKHNATDLHRTHKRNDSPSKLHRERERDVRIKLEPQL